MKVKDMTSNACCWLDTAFSWIGLSHARHLCTLYVFTICIKSYSTLLPCCHVDFGKHKSPERLPETELKFLVAVGSMQFNQGFGVGYSYPPCVKEGVHRKT